MRFASMAATSAFRLSASLLLLFCAALFTSVAAARDFVDLRRVQPITNGDAVAGEAKSALCVACHGTDGLSPVPTFPHLRDMTVEYLYTQLRDFKDSKAPRRSCNRSSVR